jgi:orotidine-5'-phosphate decarboxylase
MLTGKDRLIVALDVGRQAEALQLTRKLGNVSFFKLGLRLMLAGQVMPLIEALRDERDGQVFLDIKWGGDIGNTVTDFVQSCAETGAVRFVSLAGDSLAVRETLLFGLAARRRVGYPHFLMVPTLSSLQDTDDDILDWSDAALKLGCDGLVVSGSAIRACREEFGEEIDIVSPGIRASAAAADDHKRFATPAEAIRMGADYLVVGRPITQASDPARAAQGIIDEIDRALEER